MWMALNPAITLTWSVSLTMQEKMFGPRSGMKVARCPSVYSSAKTPQRTTTPPGLGMQTTTKKAIEQPTAAKVSNCVRTQLIISVLTRIVLNFLFPTR